MELKTLEIQSNTSHPGKRKISEEVYLEKKEVVEILEGPWEAGYI